MSPVSASQLADLMLDHHARGVRIPALSLAALNRIIDFAPEDMTVTVETGLRLAALQQELSTRGQWLPVDPPDAGNLTVHDLLAGNLSGPRRFGYGTIREHVLGMKVVLADGRTIKSGGRVVKNVAGYDLAKLFIGARDSLGWITEVTFKLRPRPAAEAVVELEATVPEMGGVLRAVLESPLTPTVLDTHRMEQAGRAMVVLGFDGTRVEVDAQMALARDLGFATPGSLEYDSAFRLGPEANRASVLPTRLPEVLSLLGSRPFVVRAGNGVIYYRGDVILPAGLMPVTLMARVKAAYDPKRILPEFTA